MEKDTLLDYVRKFSKEPLSILSQHYLSQLDQNKNIFARIPDRTEVEFARSNPDSLTTDQSVINFLCNQMKLEVVPSDKVLVLRPRFPIAFEDSTYARAAMQTRNLQAQRTGKLSVRSELEFWRNPARDPYNIAYFPQFSNDLLERCGTLVGLFPGGKDTFALSFFGSLSPSQLDALERGETLASTNLSAVSSVRLIAWLTGSRYGVNNEKGTASDFERSNWNALISLNQGECRVKLLSEPIVVARQIDPNNSSLAIYGSDPMLDGYQLGQGQTEEAFAKAKKSSWQFGTMLQRRYRVEFSNNSAYEQLLNEPIVDVCPVEGVPYSSLPASFRQAFERGYTDTGKATATITSNAFAGDILSFFIAETKCFS